MADILCGICGEQPKKYKCPTCSLPYCSIPCFKSHKITHADAAPTPAAPEPDLPHPPPPKPLPKYLRSKIDFSQLATNHKYQDLLKRHPALLSTLQNVYAVTIQPDPEQEARRRRLWNMRSRGRGRGRGRGDRDPRWTPKKGDEDAMRKLKRIRDGETTVEEKEGMEEFVELLEELFVEKEKGGDEVAAVEA